MIRKLRAWAGSVVHSDFRRNTLWVTGLSGFERVIAVVQTILISRALGITEYGIYGLLFGTIGFAASIAGLQMALTATVFVSKYRDTEKSKAAAVISTVSRFGWIIAIGFVLIAAPFSATIARYLFASTHYQFAVVLGIAYVATTTICSIQDGVAYGFEIFATLAKLRILIASIIFILIVPMADRLGLDGVMCAILGGLLLKYLVLRHLVNRCRRDADIPAVGSGVSFASLVSGFAFPSMASTLAVSFVTWLGMLLLSRQSQGFDGVAMVSTGLQWRGPVLLLAASIETVAVPAFSRYHGQGDIRGGKALRRKISLFNLVVAAGACLPVIACAGLILPLYGPGFIAGRLGFSLIVLSTIPKVVANVYMHQLMGAGRMWKALWLQCPSLVVLCAGFIVMVPRYHAVGYGLTILSGAVVLLGSVLAAEFGRSRGRGTQGCDDDA